MMDQPSMLEIVDAVRAFLEQRAMKELAGHTQFHARVAANALGIVSRELKEGPQAQARERARLAVLLGHDGPLADLNRELCKKIREGTISIDSPALKEHLDATTRDKVAIDQPGYAGLRQAPTR